MAEPVFQTDDIDFGQTTKDTVPRCECEVPKTSWKKKGDQWDCVLCGKKLTSKAQSLERFLIRQARRDALIDPKEQEES